MPPDDDDDDDGDALLKTKNESLFGNIFKKIEFMVVILFRVWFIADWRYTPFRKQTENNNAKTQIHS